MEEIKKFGKKSDVYNLQVPIDKDLESMLRKLAKNDDRTLRAYCRRILLLHAERSNKNPEILSDILTDVQQIDNEPIINQIKEESTFQLMSQKPKVGGFRK